MRGTATADEGFEGPWNLEHPTDDDWSKRPEQTAQSRPRILATKPEFGNF